MDSDKSRHKSLLAIIFFTVFLYLVGFGILIPIIPILSRDFGATAIQTGLLMSVYSFMQFLFAPFWGKLSDRKGRRPILLFCLLGEALSYVLFASARSLEWLFVARLLAGFFGASISTASAYISDITPPNERSKGMALIGTAFGLGFVVGPALGGALALWGQHISSAPHFDTSFCALWVGALCLMNFLFGLKYLRESLTQLNSKPASKKRFQLLKKYLSQKTLGAMMSVYFLSSLAMSGMEATLILFMGEKFGWKLKEVSFGFAYIGIITVFSQGFLVRRLIPIWGERKTLSVGLTSFAIGLLGIALAPSVGWMGVTMTFLALGTSFTNPSTMGAISLLSGAEEQGASMGVAQSLASLGRIIGPALGGFIYEKIAIDAPFVVSSCLAVGGLVLVFAIYNQIPNSGKRVKESVVA
jgi:DHA1 family tetracycline resistance protein-like MFS transporter